MIARKPDALRGFLKGWFETIAFMRQKRVDGHRMVVIGCNEQAVQFAHSLRSQRTIPP